MPVDVLIVEDSQTDRVLLERIVEGVGHTIRIAKSGADAKAMIEESPPDIVLLDWMLPGIHGEALTKHIRAIDNTKYIYIVFVTSKNSMDAMRTAFAAGADDYMMKPVHRDELAARLRAAERIVRLETRLRERVLELESALRRLEVSAAMKGAVAVTAHSMCPPPPAPVDASLPSGLSETTTWPRLDEILQLSVNEFLMGEFVQNGATPTHVDFDARITLTNVALGLEVALGFAADRGSAEALAQRLFGEPEDDAMLQDLLGEIANTAMGAVKAAFSAEGQAFTAGIPTSGRGDGASWLAEHHPWHRGRVLDHEGVHLAITVAVRQRPTRELKAKELGEGMVLARDVKDDNGVLLVASGTRVSATLAGRLGRIAPNVRVQIIDAAVS